jgi:hypothetical protein
MHNASVIFFSLFLIWACSSKKDVVPTVTGTEYFPISVGDSTVYQVVITDTSVSGTVTNSNYFLMEIIQDTFVNAAHGISYYIDRYTSPTLTSSSWTYDSTFYEYKTSYEAVRVESNVPYIKLSFPAQNNRQWDGNALNVDSVDKYTMVNLGMSYQLGNVSYPQTLIVLESADTTFNPIIGQNKKLEVYAYNIGLIYKQHVIIDINYSSSGNGVLSRTGTNYKQSLVSYDGAK